MIVVMRANNSVEIMLIQATTMSEIWFKRRLIHVFSLLVHYLKCGGRGCCPMQLMVIYERCSFCVTVFTWPCVDLASEKEAICVGDMRWRWQDKSQDWQETVSKESSGVWHLCWWRWYFVWYFLSWVRAGVMWTPSTQSTRLSHIISYSSSDIHRGDHWGKCRKQIL